MCAMRFRASYYKLTEFQGYFEFVVLQPDEVLDKILNRYPIVIRKSPVKQLGDLAIKLTALSEPL